jgi:hypothetical protein
VVAFIQRDKRRVVRGLLETETGKPSCELVAILPLVRSSADRFAGQQYLGLYIEDINWETGRRGFGISTGTRTPRPLRSLVASGYRV